MTDGDTARWAAEVRATLRAADVDVSRVDVADAPEELGSLAPGRWVLLPRTDGGWLVGTVAEGLFVPYDQYDDLPRTARELRRLTREPPPRARLSYAETEALAAASVYVTRGVVAAVEVLGRPAPAGIPTGAALDRLGHDSGTVLHVFGTSMAERALPPRDQLLPYHVYVVRRPFPPAVRQSLAPADYGQPGGGGRVVLDRPVRWYCDAGVLQEVETLLLRDG